MRKRLKFRRDDECSCSFSSSNTRRGRSMLRKMWNLSTSGAAVAPGGGKGECCGQHNHGNTKEQLFSDLHQEVRTNEWWFSITESLQLVVKVSSVNSWFPQGIPAKIISYRTFTLDHESQLPKICLIALVQSWAAACFESFVKYFLRGLQAVGPILQLQCCQIK